MYKKKKVICYRTTDKSNKGFRVLPSLFAAWGICPSEEMPRALGYAKFPDHAVTWDGFTLYRSVLWNYYAMS
jgi:hypothetical protein